MTSRTSATPELVSVVLPVKESRYLDQALESVLAQDYRPFEVVVIDSSEGGVRSFVDGFGPIVRYERQWPPAGIAIARNRGVELASGTLLTFLDADDLFEPGRLRRQAMILEADPSLEAVFGQVTEFVQPGLAEGAAEALRAPRSAFPSHLVWTMLIRRTAFERVGAFQTDYVVGETVDWYARAVSAGLRSVMLDRVVARRRLHDANTGLVRWDARRDFVRLAREALVRRRAREASMRPEGDA